MKKYIQIFSFFMSSYIKIMVQIYILFMSFCIKILFSKLSFFVVAFYRNPSKTRQTARAGVLVLSGMVTPLRIFTAPVKLFYQSTNSWCSVYLFPMVRWIYLCSLSVVVACWFLGCGASNYFARRISTLVL